MSRDYAKKTRSKKRRHPRRKKGNLFKRVLLICLLGLIGSFGYRYSNLDINKLKSDVVKTVKLNPKNKKPTPSPTFEFYTRLPNFKDPQNKTDQPLTSSQSVISANQPDKSAEPVSQSKYLIQVGSFKNFKDADRLKATLTLQGYHTQLSQFTNHSTTWFRVEVGPFPSLKQTKQQQQKLEKNHINGLIKQVG